MSDILYKYQYHLLTVFILLIFGGVSCTSDEEIIPGYTDSDRYLRIIMDIPRMDTQRKASGNSTRAMSADAEKAIDPSLLHILVFKSGNFLYEAPVKGSISYDSGNKSKASVTVKLVKSKDANDKCKILIIANHHLDGVTLNESTTIEQLRSSIIYELPEKWDTSENTYRPFPMWGETSEMSISEQTSSISAQLYRAIAKIDIGLNLKMLNGKFTEEAEGISEFSLKQVYIYRTYTSGTVIPSSDYPSKVNIPSTATRRDDSSPLSYELTEEQGGNDYIREIYVPEADIPSDPHNNNIHCIVVGGYYRGSSNITYYRLDFAEEANLGGRNFRPILRNHRYVFNITKVSGPGFTSPEAALESSGTINDIGYELIVWDDKIGEMDVKGQYYFGITRHVVLDSNKGSTAQAFFQTNYPLTTASDLTYEWGKGEESPFNVIITNLNNKMLMIASKGENTTNTILSDTLYITTGPFRTPVLVEQRYVNFKYTINCGTIRTYGTYVKGRALNPNEHYIDLSITAEDRTLQGKKLILRTEDLEGDHGIQFEGEILANFSGIPEGAPLTNTVRLKGNGTLLSDEIFSPIKLRINSNSSSGSYCEAVIHPVGDELNIVVLAGASLHGYGVSTPNTGYPIKCLPIPTISDRMTTVSSKQEK